MFHLYFFYLTMDLKIWPPSHPWSHPLPCPICVSSYPSSLTITEFTETQTSPFHTLFYFCLSIISKHRCYKIQSCCELRTKAPGYTTYNFKVSGLFFLVYWLHESLFEVLSVSRVLLFWGYPSQSLTFLLFLILTPSLMFLPCLIFIPLPTPFLI